MIRPVNIITAKSNLGIGGREVSCFWFGWMVYTKLNPVVNNSRELTVENAQARVDIWKEGRASVVI
jgi:hypothetical protein